MQAIRKIFHASLFFVTTISLAFVLYPAIRRLVQLINSGVSEGDHYYNPYTRFVPSSYQPGVTLAFDLGLSVLGAAALFYWAMLVARRRKSDTPTSAPTPKPVDSTAKNAEQSARFKRRLLLIPAWLVAQFIWNLFSGASAFDALLDTTSIESLFTSAVVITGIVLYARGYEIGFGNDAAKKPGAKGKQHGSSPRSPS
jgi:hypothetical protein